MPQTIIHYAGLSGEELAEIAEQNRFRQLRPPKTPLSFSDGRAVIAYCTLLVAICVVWYIAQAIFSKPLPL